MDIGLAVANQVQRGLPIHQLELDRTTGNPAIFAPQIDQQAIGLTLFIEVGEGLPGLELVTMSGLGGVFANTGHACAKSNNHTPHQTRHRKPESPAIPAPTLLFGRLCGHRLSPPSA